MMVKHCWRARLQAPHRPAPHTDPAPAMHAVSYFKRLFVLSRDTNSLDSINGGDFSPPRTRCTRRPVTAANRVLSDLNFREGGSGMLAGISMVKNGIKSLKRCSMQHFCCCDSIGHHHSSSIPTVFQRGFRTRTNYNFY